MAGLAIALVLFVQGSVTAIDGRCFEDAETTHCLTGITAPSLLTTGEAGASTIEAGKQALQALLGDDIFIEPVGDADRWGRQPVLAFTNDGTPLQTALLQGGHVSLIPEELPAPYAQAFRDAQRTAQDDRAGLWSLEAHRVLYEEESAAATGEMRFIRGRVLYAYEGRDWTYLNFGADYKTDFTIMIKPRLARQMAEAGRAPETFEGDLVEIFGLIHNENGPAVELTDGANLIVIEESR